MEVKIGHVYLCRFTDGKPAYLVKINKQNGKFYSVTKIVPYNGNILPSEYFDSSCLACEIDPSVFDKAMNLHNVYLTSLKSLIQANEN